MNLMKLSLLVLVLLFAAEMKGQDKWAVADRQIVRLAPNKFSQLPKAIVSDLERRRCSIPQSYIRDAKHNVIKGEFKRKGQKDWAVLCSNQKTSIILIYWNGSVRGVSKIASADDNDFLQGIGNGKIGFSRIISVVNAKYINNHYKAYGGARPPNIRHNGIDNGFAEKASVVLYLHRGKWLELQGAD